MKIRFALLSALLLLSSACWALEQEETFTNLTPGQDMLDPANLSELLQRGDVRAMNNVALLWAKGHDGKQSYDEALRWWKEAAKRGYTVAMNNIGLMYANGDGVEKNFKQAFDWWHQSAFLGNAWAMNSVGDLYENGLGVSKDLGMAMTWYQSASEQGEPMAMYNVGLLFEAGKGVDRDPGVALSWFRRSADKGYASAMHSLGAMHAEGRGLPADLVEAFAWYSVADLRYPPEDAAEAKQNKADLEKLAAGLSADQLARGKERAATLESLTRPAPPVEQTPENARPGKPGEKST